LPFYGYILSKKILNARRRDERLEMSFAKKEKESDKYKRYFIATDFQHDS
jgi:hypothetical protein